MFGRMIDDFKDSTGSALRLSFLAAAAAVALFVTTSFLCAAAFVFVLQNYGLIQACFTGAGIFFVGYVPFEVPSNFMLAKVGARLWLTVLLVLMGLVSAGFAFVHTSNSYMVMRFLLGAAESGFFPGVVLYLTFWLPASVRGGLMSLFIVSIPLSTVVGAPLSMAMSLPRLQTIKIVRILAN